MEKIIECTIKQTLFSKNPYVELEVDRNDMKTNTVSETKISKIDCNQKDNKHNPVRYCTSTKEPVEEPKRNFETKHNLQNRRGCN